MISISVCYIYSCITTLGLYAYYNVHSIIDNIEILILRAHGALIRDYTVYGFTMVVVTKVVKMSLLS